MRFSERTGHKALRDIIQIGGMDAALRNSLWNVFSERFAEITNVDPFTRNSVWASLYQAIWRDFWKQPVERIPSETWKTREVVAQWFQAAEWFEVYDFVEFSIAVGGVRKGAALERAYNRVLIREVAGYRVVDGTVAPITNEIDLRTIEDALAVTRNSAFRAVETHLVAALSMLADRKTPDYRNSIKESISAVEAMVRLISGHKKAELGKALDRLAKGSPVHPALRKGFGALYGFTSDASGIRHALSDSTAAEFEDAKYMLGSCSAFVYYLTVKAGKAGLQLA